jgi:hypothetical protein
MSLDCELNQVAQSIGRQRVKLASEVMRPSAICCGLALRWSFRQAELGDLPFGEREIMEYDVERLSLGETFQLLLQSICRVLAGSVEVE